MDDKKVKVAIIGAGSATAAIAAQLLALDVEVVDQKKFLLVDDSLPSLKPQDLKVLTACEVEDFMQPLRDEPPIGWYQRFNNPRKKGKKR